MSAQDIGALALLSLRDPAEAARYLIGLRLPMAVRWMGLALVAILAILFICVTAALLPSEDLTALGKAMQTPLPGLAIQGGSILLIAALMALVGRLFGGQGGFADALLLMVWMEFLTLPLTLLQLVLLFSIPFATVPVALVSLALFIRIFLVFTATLHGFSRLWAVAAVSVATLVALSMTLAVLMVALGYNPTMGTV